MSTKATYHLRTISEGFGRARMPVANPFLHICMDIARRRREMLAHARKEDGFIRDDQNQIQSLKTDIYGSEIREIALMFQKLQHSPVLYRHCSDLARQAALRAKRDPALNVLHTQWDKSDGVQRFQGLETLSHLTTDILNDSEKHLNLRYPIMARTRFPQASRGIGMQLQEARQKDNPDERLFLLPINNDVLVESSFEQCAAMLWHEHQHMYMAGLRDIVRDGTLPPSHPLYNEAYKSATLHDYQVCGNFLVAKEIYYAEPEEKLCFFTQDVFDKVLRSRPKRPALEMRAC